VDPRRHTHASDRRRGGFSLVELVVVMVVSGIVAGTVGIFLSRPMEGYQDLSRRAALVDAADVAARRMARDVHRALPNSIRVATAGGRTALELLHTVDGARYRAVPGVNGGGQDHTADTDVLSFFGDDRWNVLGRLRGASFAYGTPLPAGTRVAIYTTQTGLTWADAAGAGGPALLTPAGTAVTIVDDGDEDQIVLSASHRFRFASPGRRLYLVDEPVTYLCDPASETLTRVAAYAPTAGQPTDPAVAPLAGGASAVVTDRVSACNFTWQPGAPSQRSGLLTVDLSLADEGETVRLLRQVHVANVP
jgi:MSHA biogenesis protein MshO